MAKEKLQIILDAEWRGKQAVKQADKSFLMLSGAASKPLSKLILTLTG
jgi:hypothetical protein